MPFSFPRPLTACRRALSRLLDAFALPASLIPPLRLQQAPNSEKSPTPETPIPQQPVAPLASTLRQPSLDSLNLNRAAAACATLVRLGYNWRGGHEWAPPIGSPPPYITGEDNREAIWAHSGARKILLKLGYRYVRDGDYGRWARPVPNSDAGEALADFELDQRRRRLSKGDLDRADAACATLVHLGYAWLGGDQWKQALGAKNASDRLDALVSASQHSQAVATLRRLGWRFIAGQWIEAPPGPSIAEPPPEKKARPSQSDEAVERLLRRLRGVAESLRDHPPNGLIFNAEFFVVRKMADGWTYSPVSFSPSDLSCLLAPESEAPPTDPTRDMLNRIAKALGIPAGDFLKPLPEPAPGVADKLRDAIEYAIFDPEHIGIGWLKAWWEGDDKAEQEFEEWRLK